MEERGYLLFADGHKEYFEEGIQVVQFFANRNDKQELVEIRLPDSVAMIARDTFRNCTNLRKVSCNTEYSSLQHIGWYAFDGCEKLQEFDVPDRLRTIDACAFAETGLHMMDLSRSDLAYLGDTAFCMCKNLMKVLLPNSVSVIPQDCFYHCKNLMMVGFEGNSGSVDLVGRRAFIGCDNLVKGPAMNNESVIQEANDPLKALL